MLDLASRTPQAWVHQALADMDTILLDHAHCEKKAASTGINLIFRYPDRAEMMVPLSALAREELEHFELVIAKIESRGKRFLPMRPSLYARRLQEAVRKTEPTQLLDTLLCFALIEARSCERMKLLSEALAESGGPGHADLAEFYRSLLASEARHFHGYIQLAYGRYPREVVRARLHELAEHEAVVNAEPEDELRFHGGAVVWPSAEAPA
jgi:tRNA-(ms[2]io[6]A)-hydroxylase